MAGERFRHLFLVDHPGIEPFTSPSSGGTKKRIPSRNRQTHSEYLMQRFIEAWQEAEAEQAVHHVDRNGVYIEFKIMTLLNVRLDPGAILMQKVLLKIYTSAGL